jgi:hypothetical protein
MSQRTVQLGALIALTLAILHAAGCQSRRAVYGRAFDTIRDDMSRTLFKLYVNECTSFTVAEIEFAADSIAVATDDRRVERNALLWKMNGISAAQMAGHRLDPTQSMFDLWLFIVQMRELFEREPDLFGDQQHLALAAVDRAEAEMRQIATLVTPDDESFTRWARTIDEFAAAGPLEGLLFARDPNMRSFRRVAERPEGAWQALGTIEEIAIDLAARSTEYANTLPKQARWQSELVLLEVENNAVVRGFVEQTEAAADAVVRGTAVFEQIPARFEEINARLDEHQSAITSSLDGGAQVLAEAATQEQEAVLEALDVERREIVNALTDQSQQLLVGVDAQRLDTLHALRDERAIILAAIAAEREAILTSVGAIAAQTFDEADAELEQVVDHAFWRSVQLLVVVVVLVPFVAKLYLVILRPKGS